MLMDTRGTMRSSKPLACSRTARERQANLPCVTYSGSAVPSTTQAFASGTWTKNSFRAALRCSA